ncbi:MAG: class I poly(R)-hydroxyalkanoic acid synthase [Paracoccaceae bacterium]|nr:class I poly(R)-hydroxyalkanoic acid synthase [Paracoccaceae bacterium]
MTTTDQDIENQTSKLEQNLAKLDELNQRLITVLQTKKTTDAALSGPGHDLALKTTAAYWQEAIQNPSRLIEHQIAYWGKTLTHFIEAQNAMMHKDFDAVETSALLDKRFSNPLWNSHPYFKFIKQQYLHNAEVVQSSIESIDGLETTEKRRLEYFSRQIVDMMAPTNFLATNPDALEQAVETQGQSLIDGLENLIADLEDNDGELVVRLADEKAFELGGNIATTPGKVVFRNHMLELIQYSPSTQTTHEIPLVIFPPWINKFYILDLTAQNSLIKWLVAQGLTVFIVSWINPDASYKEVSLEDYIEHGYLQALQTVRSETGQDKVNAVGYCIGGTTLALTLALLKQRGEELINSATFFTTLTDFSNQGEFLPFLQNDFIDGIEQEVGTKGILESYIMARTFSFLRSNDLIYSPAIKSYMMGKAPPAFDLLYWNGDGANLPAKMAVQYLRGLCQRNEFAEGGFELFGKKLHLRNVDVPLCAVACETDHIANWKDSYRGVAQMGGRSKTFILAESGHIAGIINPPGKNKYGFFLNFDPKKTPEKWHSNAKYHAGSWWNEWASWLKKRSGKQRDALVPGSDSLPVICDAPGLYVTQKAKV